MSEGAPKGPTVSAPTRRTVALIGSGGIVILVVCIFLLPSILVPSRSYNDLQRISAQDRIRLRNERLKLRNDVRTTLLQALGGSALLIGGYLTWQQVLVSRRQLQDNFDNAQNQLALGRETQVVDRFTQAVDQLGNEKLSVRIGGIFALEQLATTSATYRDAIIQILTAYVRDRCPWPPTPPDLPEQQISRLVARIPDGHAAMTALSRFQVTTKDTVELVRVDLRKMYIEGMNLAFADLQDASLEGAYLSQANLEGAFLIRTDLRSTFLVEAKLDKSYLHGANLKDAKLGEGEKRASFQGAKADSSTIWPSEDFDWKSAGIVMDALLVE